jgi:hypothetical protein
MNNLNTTNNNIQSDANSELIIRAEWPVTDYEFTTNKQKRENILKKGQKLRTKGHSITERNLNTKHINHQIYHLLLDPFTMDNAYKNLSKNKGGLALQLREFCSF